MIHTEHTRQMSRQASKSTPKRRNALLLMTALLALASPAAFAQAKAAGTIEGRVLNTANGQYLSKAVISIDGSNLQALSDDYGNYTLTNVPAGEVKIKIAYTGQQPQFITVNVKEGQSVIQDVKLDSTTGKLSKEGDLVMLDPYVVASERYKSAAEIAINEERYSPVIKNVIAAEAFGDIPDGNIGEFVKYIPGVQIGYGYDSTGMNAAASNATSVSVRGFGPEMTQITIDGVPLTNASPASLTRAIGLDMMSINNASRIEVIKVPTPDMPSNSPGGSINLITKSAFEYSKPFLSWKLSMNVNSEDTKNLFSKTPGPAQRATYKTLPGAEFTYVVPISKSLGFSFTGAWSQTFNENHRGQSDYLYATKDVNSGTTYKLDLTPGGGPLVDVAAGPIKDVQSIKGTLLNLSNPAMYRFQMTDTPNMSTRTSSSLKLDWRPNSRHLLTFGYTMGLFDTVDAQRRLQYYSGKGYTADWGDGYVTSYQFIAKGTMVNGKALAADFNPGATIATTVTTRDRSAATNTGYLNYTYKRGAWNIDGMINASRSRGSYKDLDNKHFSGVDLNLGGGKIAFSGIQEGIPSKIDFWDKAGAVLDYTKLANFPAATFTAQSGLTDAVDQKFNAKINIRRDLDFISNNWFSASFKTGFYRQQSMTKKWGLGTGYRMTYVGPALNYSQYLDDGYDGVSPGFGLPGQQWVSTYKLYSLWQDNPTYFNADSESDKVSNYSSWANQQKKMKETSDQYYVMLDGRALKNRMSWVLGARQEIDTREGYTTVTNSTWNYVKNADGSIWRNATLGYPTGVKIDSATSPLFAVSAAGDALRSALTAAGVKYPTAGVLNNSLAMKQLQLVPFTNMDGRVKQKPSYSLSSSYNITEDLKFTASWSRKMAPVDYENGILTGAGTFTITENSDNTASPKGTITVANPNLKPWTADSYDAQLAYYTKSGGKIAATVFSTNTKNFHETISITNIDNNYEATLEAIGLTPSLYDDYKITTVLNGLGTSQTRGLELEARQNLAILASWVRDVDVFANYSHQYIKQVNTTALSAKPTAKNTLSGGVTYTNRRVSIMVRGLYVEEKYTGQATYTFNGVTYILGTYNPAVLNLDLNARYQFSKRYGFFLNARNFTNKSQDTVKYDTDTGLVPAWAKNTNRNVFGVNWVLGINGSF
jgi:TonB-dependent receptor